MMNGKIERAAPFDVHNEIRSLGNPSESSTYTIRGPSSWVTILRLWRHCEGSWSRSRAVRAWISAPGEKLWLPGLQHNRLQHYAGPRRSTFIFNLLFGICNMEDVLLAFPLTEEGQSSELKPRWISAILGTQWTVPFLNAIVHVKVFGKRKWFLHLKTLNLSIFDIKAPLFQ